MAQLNFRVQNALAGTFRAMDEVNAAAATVGGWRVAKTSAGFSGELTVGVEQTTFSSNTTTPKPSALITGATPNAWRSVNQYKGDFDATAWTIKVACRSVSTAFSGTGRARVRVFASVNADGSSARELTAATQVGTTVGPGSTSADVVSTVTWTPAAGFTLSNEYIFIAIAWEIVTASGSNTADCDIRTGSSGTTTGSNILTGNFTAAVSASGSDSGSASESATAAPQKQTGTARIALGSVGAPPAGAVTLHVRAKMGGSDSGILRVWLYQGATLIEGPYDISLSTSFATDDHAVANAGSITDWTSLEVRVQGISSTAHDTLTPQVSYIALESPLSTGSAISGTDAGSDSEANVLSAQTPGTDAGSDSEIAAINLAGTDAGGDSETSTVAVPMAGTDAGSDTEAILKIAISGISDSGTDSEAFTEVAQIPGTDSGSDAESGSLRFLGADNGTETEAQSETAQIPGTDSGADAEVGSIAEITTDAGSDSEAFIETAQIPGTDAGSDSELGKLSLAGSDSGTDAEAQTETAQIPVTENGSDSETSKISEISSDSGTEAEANTLTAQVPATDANGATAENASTGTPVTATDTSSDSEVSQLVAKASSPDSGTDSEIPRIGLNGTDGNLDSETPALHAALQPTDSGTAADNATTNTQNSFTSSEAAGASETAQGAASLSSGPEGATGAENASVRVFLNPLADAGTSLEAQVEKVLLVLAEAGISIDSAEPQVSWIRTDSGAGSETQIQLVTPLISEDGIGSDGYTISAQLVEDENALDAEVADRIDLTAAPLGIERNLIATGVEQGVLILADTEIAVVVAKSPERGSLLRAR